MRLQVQTAPQVEPITTSEAVVFCRIDDDVAVKYAAIFPILINPRARPRSRSSGRWLITQTIDAYFDRFPCGNYADPVRADYAIRLPPLQSVTSIVYTRRTAFRRPSPRTSTTWTRRPGRALSRIEPSYGNAWPSHARCSRSRARALRGGLRRRGRRPCPRA
jgi:hypothetical protein